MKRLFYGVAVSALVLGAGGVAMACEQHAHSAALMSPAATQAFSAGGAVLAQSQSDSDSAKSDDEEKKPEALPSSGGNRMMAQQQQEEQSGTSGEDNKSGEDQK